MLVLAVKPGHDSAVAAVGDHKLLVSLEAEKDSFQRHRGLSLHTMMSAAEYLGEPPDVIAIGGWARVHSTMGAPYTGADEIIEAQMRLFGKRVEYFSSSHERSHILMALGMGPPQDSPQHAVLVWAGHLGHIYLIEGKDRIAKRVPVLAKPGARWAFLFALADPTFPEGANHRVEDSGKLMALAAFGDPADATPEIVET